MALSQVPISPALAELLADDPDLLLSAVTGGDDYELIFAVAPEQVPDVLAAAAATDTSITEIGVFTAAKDVIFTDSDGQVVTLPKAGFIHF